MKRFTLLVKKHSEDRKIQEMRTRVQQHLNEGGYCFECSEAYQCPTQNKDLCPIIRCNIIPVQDFGFADADSMQEILIIINTYKLIPNIDFLILIDVKDDIGYIHKGSGDLEYIEKTPLSQSVTVYEKMHQVALKRPAKLMDLREQHEVYFSNAN